MVYNLLHSCHILPFGWVSLKRGYCQILGGSGGNGDTLFYSLFSVIYIELPRFQGLTLQLVSEAAVSVCTPSVGHQVLKLAMKKVPDCERARGAIGCGLRGRARMLEVQTVRKEITDGV